MFQFKSYFLLLLFLNSGFNQLFSQITITPTAGCAPLGVLCSGPSGATNVYWNLGGTAGSSTLNITNPIYNTPGTYNITYTALVGGQPVNYSKQLIVTAGPSGNFSYSQPSSHCAPMVVNFNCNGGASGSTYTWDFGDFVQGSGSTQTHTYNFQGSYIPVVIITDAVTGCSAIATAPPGNTVFVSNPPNGIISSSQGFIGCTPPFTTAISGSLSTSGSPKPGPLGSFSWNMGGGTPAVSGSINPGLVTFPQGQHTITLNLTDNNSCSATFTKVVTVSNPSLSVSYPNTVCINSYFSAVVNANISPHTWTINGSTFTHTNNQGSPTIVDSVAKFTTPGYHTFSVSIFPGGNCVPVMITHTIFVEEVIPSFTWTPPGASCSSPMLANFISNSSTNSGSTLNYLWSATWPPSASNTVLVPTTNSPTATFTLIQGSANPYTIYKYHVPNIYLKVTSNSSAQCSATTWTIGTDTLILPTAWFNTNKREGCAPLTVKFIDSTFINPVFPIASYTWCNGATPPLNVTGFGSVPANQTFTYSNTGIYKPYLIIQTTNGCRDTSFKDSIVVANPPNISGLSLIPSFTSVCAGQPITFSLSSSPTNTLVDHWHLDTDQHFFSGCISDNTPTFPFSHVGPQNFTVSAYQSGCRSESVMPLSLTIKGPYSKFRFETNCDVNKKSVNFYSHLQEVQTATLYFGDNTHTVIPGNVSSTIGNTVMSHIYPSRGNYTASIVSVNNLSGCGPHTFSMVVRIREPRARITYTNGSAVPASPLATDCTKSRYKFSAALSTDAHIGCCRGYAWYLTTPNYTLPPIDISYTSFGLSNATPWPYVLLYPPLDNISLDTFRVAGNYTLTLQIKDENGCIDTTTRKFRIGNAEPVFSFNANPLCLSDTLRITNNTQASQVSPDAITNYTWSFGDGLSSVQTSTNPLFNPKHKYLNTTAPSQTVSVMCIAKNSLGCIDTAVKVLQVNNPIPNFKVGNPPWISTILCIPKNGVGTTTFNATPGFSSYSVSYGTPTSAPVWQNYATLNNVSFSYNTPGVYTPSIIVTDNLGCKASETLQVIAYGQPTAGISYIGDLNKFCAIGTPTIVSTTSLNVTPPTNYLWTIGGSSSLALDTIRPIISALGAHIVSLQVSVSGYCSSTATTNLYVFNPNADFNLDRDTFCLGEQIKVNIIDTVSTGVVGWQWFFGDNVPQLNILAGSFLANQTKTLNYTYNVFPPGGNNGYTTMYLLYYSAEKACVKTATANVQVIKIDANFTQSDSVYKHCLGLSDAFNNTTPNPLQLDLKYNWSVETKTFSTKDIAHTFTVPGTYPVNLKINDPTFGCKAEITKNMTVFPLPTGNFSVKDSTCPNERFIIFGDGKAGVSGPISALIKPLSNNDTLKISQANTFSVYASAPVTTEFTLKVKDNNNCESPDITDLLYVQQPAPFLNWDTTIIIGEPIPLNSYSGFGFTYTWTPLITDLNCTNCIIPNPISTSTNNVTYSVTVEDKFKCATVYRTYNINILPKTSLDVPTAFTPNGDGTNDVIYADGWGIRKLNYFKIFNRWGQLLFETNDLQTGWDGKFNGSLQNMETYVFQVSVDTYTNETITKSGTFKLLR